MFVIHGTACVADRPLTPIRLLAREASKRPEELFSVICGHRPSFSCRWETTVCAASGVLPDATERMLTERVRDTLLFRRFVRLDIEDAVRENSVFSENRDRLLKCEVVDANAVADKLGLSRGNILT